MVVRADMRGSGDSDGVYFDEYLQQEQEDCVQLIGGLEFCKILELFLFITFCRLDFQTALELW